MTGMTAHLTSLVASVVPLLVVLGLFMWFFRAANRQTSGRYEAQAARMKESIELQRRAVDLSQESVARLREIRDLLRRDI